MYTNVKHCFHSCHQCDNIDGLNKYKQQTMNNLQFYSCARSQHAHAIRINWLNIITIGSTSIKEVTEIRFLGVTFDTKLNWNAHITQVQKKIKNSICNNQKNFGIHPLREP